MKHPLKGAPAAIHEKTSFVCCIQAAESHPRVPTTSTRGFLLSQLRSKASARTTSARLRGAATRATRPEAREQQNGLVLDCTISADAVIDIIGMLSCNHLRCESAAGATGRWIAEAALWRRCGWVDKGGQAWAGGMVWVGGRVKELSRVLQLWGQRRSDCARYSLVSPVKQHS